MAHRPVGIATSVALSGTAATCGAFLVQSDVIRLVAKGAPAQVSIGTDPIASASDYYIPSGGTATLALTKQNQIVSGITTGTTTKIDAPEGMSMPFGPGDHVSLSAANDANYTTKINNVSVLSVDTRSLSHIDGGLFQQRITVAADTSGIITAYTSNSAGTLRSTLKVSAKDPDGGSGVLYIQQVQLTGDA
tara:strand:+ start:3685 stop:4257 length:573 start_codon:yes stop_codon:yes gene_type:complete